MLNYETPLTDTAIIQIRNSLDSYIDRGYKWGLHSSTNQNAPGVAFDLNLPMFEDNLYGKMKVILAQCWAQDSSLTTQEEIRSVSGFGFIQFLVNKQPTVDDVDVRGIPENGTALETQFSMACSGGYSEQVPITYSIGYLIADDDIKNLAYKDARRCTWVLLGCMLFVVWSNSFSILF